MKQKISFFVLMLISTLTVLHAQISSRAIKPEELPKLVKYYQDTPLDYVKLSFVDVEKLKKEDEAMRDKVEYLRYGKVVDVDLGFKQGKRTICQGGHKWYWAVTSKDALSLDFAFDNFFLPEGAELHIYNARKTMLIGPITPKQNSKRSKLSTFSLEGDSAIVELYLPIQVSDKSIFHISSVIHGYVNFLNGNSGSPGTLICTTHINANCPEGNTMENEKRAVTLLVSEGRRICTGTLLNNACNNLRPNILTALHCVDGIASNGFQDGEIDAAEKAFVSNMLFVFHYKTSGCSGNSAPINLCFEGANVLTSQANSDMALFELQQQPNVSSDVRYAGWSNAVAIPNTAFGISHPLGNPMKLAFEDNEPVRETWNLWRTPLLSWSVIWNRGAVERGSSGSALFNPQNRVIGQLAGFEGTPTNPSVCNANKKFYGRLDASWNTIRPHLSDDPSVTQTNTVGIPSFTFPDVICGPTPMSVDWNGISNMSIAGGSLQGVTGSNVPSATQIWFEPLPNYSGNGFLNVNFKPNGITCNTPLVIRKDFYVGKPTPSVQFANDWFPCENWFVASGKPNDNYNWVIHRYSTNQYFTGQNVLIQNYGASEFFWYELTVTNACGSTTVTGSGTLNGCGGNPYLKGNSGGGVNALLSKNYKPTLSISPNPATQEATLNIKDISPIMLNTLCDVVILNQMGQAVVNQKLILENVIRLDINNLANGFYVVEVKGENGLSLSQKLVVNKK